jgi:hypothetical protein
MVCRLRLENQEMEILPDDPYQAAAWQRHRAMVEHEIQWLSKQLASERTVSTKHELSRRA